MNNKLSHPYYPHTPQAIKFTRVNFLFTQHCFFFRLPYQQAESLSPCLVGERRNSSWKAGGSLAKGEAKGVKPKGGIHKKEGKDRESRNGNRSHAAGLLPDPTSLLGGDGC